MSDTNNKSILEINTRRTKDFTLKAKTENKNLDVKDALVSMKPKKTATSTTVATENK